MKKKLFIFSIIIGSFFFIGCKQKINHCSKKDLHCTKILKTIHITIKYKDQNPVQLDSIVIKKAIPNTNILVTQPVNQPKGYYKLISDLEKTEIEKTGSEIVFCGYFQGVNIINKTFIVGHDCCHVELLSGNKVVTIAK